MRTASRPAISSTVRARSREGESTPSGPPPEKTRTRCGAPGAKSAPTMSLFRNAADLVALLLQVLEKAFAAEEALLLSRHGREEKRRPIRALRQEARALDRHGDARGVVVGARRVGFRIHHGGGHRVEVPRDEEDGLRELRVAPRQEREHVLHPRGLVVRARRGRLEAVHDDRQPPARRLRDLAQRATSRSRPQPMPRFGDRPRKTASAACRRRRALRSSRAAPSRRSPGARSRRPGADGGGRFAPSGLRPDPARRAPPPRSHARKHEFDCRGSLC